MGRIGELCLAAGLSFVVGATVGFVSRAHYVREKNRRNKERRGEAKVAAVTNNGSRVSSAAKTIERTTGNVNHLVDVDALTDAARDEAATDGLVPHHCQSPHLPECFLMLHHVSKNRNVGSLIRTATAFGCTAVICVGLRKISQLSFFGAHGSDKRIKVLCFLYMDEAVNFLQERAKSQGRAKCHVVGLEITPESKMLPDPKTFAPFTNASPDSPKKVDNICIIPGNEGSGLTDKDRQYCDYCVVIPQFGSATASLNVCSATAILLYQFAVAAGYAEAGREGEKYSVSSWISAQETLKDQGLDRVGMKKQKEEKQQAAPTAGGQDEASDEEEGLTF